MRKILYIILVGLVSVGYSQKNEKLLSTDLRNAGIYFNSEDYLNALKDYKNILIIDKKNETANLNALICEFKLGMPVDSVMEYLVVVQNSKIPEAMFYMGKVTNQLKNFDNAINYFSKYKKIQYSKLKIRYDEENQKNNL